MMWTTGGLESGKDINAIDVLVPEIWETYLPVPFPCLPGIHAPDYHDLWFPSISQVCIAPDSDLSR